VYKKNGDAPKLYTSGQYKAAKDSISAISKRRANDEEFWNKMSK